MEFIRCLKSLACLGLGGPVGYPWFWETALAPVTHCPLPCILKKDQRREMKGRTVEFVSDLE